MKRVLLYTTILFLILFGCASPDEESSEADLTNNASAQQIGGGSSTGGSSTGGTSTGGSSTGGTSTGGSSTGGTSTGGSSTGSSNHASYPLPPAPLFTTPYDLSDLTLGSGETANATFTVMGSTSFHFINYIFIEDVELEVTIDGVAQPSRQFSPNLNFPKQQYIPANENRLYHANAGDVSNGFQRLFVYSCDTNSGKVIEVTLTVDYVLTRSDGYGGTSSTTPRDYSYSYTYNCDGSQQTPFSTNFPGW